MAVEEQHQTTTFDDQVVAPIIAPPTQYRDLDVSDPTTSSELGDFLKRPVRIYSGTWATSEGAGVKTSVNPWFEYLNNANIKYKLNNYGFIRGNLHVKVVINASPFYYGACLVNYTPMHTFHGRDSETTNDMFYIPESQKPSFMIYPQENRGGDMVLPFYYNKNYLNLTSADDLEDMGLMKLIIYSPLRSANGAVGTGCSIQMYAWMEESILAGPTIKLAVQAQDEYGLGPVSGPASAAAAFAGQLKSLPIIGKFATATEIGAKAVSGMAQIFGFTNVPVIEPTAPLALMVAPQFASSQIGHPVQKLTFDPKTELTVDNGAVGFTADDELTIQKFVTRKSFLAKTTWTTSTALDVNLFSTLVSPTMFDSVALVGQRRLAMTPLDVAQRMFRFWRGDLIFTFRIVASKYHKGRLRLAYDPIDASVVGTNDVGATVQNMIYDLGHEEEEIEFRVPYSAGTTWLRTLHNNVTKSWKTNNTAVTRDPLYDNGVLTLKVLTLLTAPIASSTVDILVYVRGAENMEFAGPNEIEGNLSQFAIQSQDERTPSCKVVSSDGGDDGTIISQRGRIYMGEQIRSFRHLLRRTSYFDRAFSTPAIVGNTYGTMGRFPPSFGYHSTGIHTARNLGGTANVPFNWSPNLPYHLLSTCFLGQRGAMNWTLTPTYSSSTVLKARREVSGVEVASVMPWNTVAASLTYSGTQARISWDRGTDAAGAAVASTNSTALAISVPDYSAHKFRSTAPTMGTNWALDPGSAFDAVGVEYASVSGHSHCWDRCVGVGTDYNVVYFMYVPLWYVYNAVPADPV
nr:MAG: hypothetical protein 2 [Marnaviridae sp.]